ncbi:MAG: 4-alpha-glucanotransferase [Pseudomonadales bacterium]|nr:4-alpha-glucanotransferase [Pseudomonadales bacterium]
MKTPLNRRASGVLLHPSSLPGNSFHGSFGEDAYRFIDFLANGGFHYWQILPTGPTDCNYSPYQSSSAFAGNSLFISLDKVAEMGFLNRDQPSCSSRKEHHRSLKQAFNVFQNNKTPQQREEFEHFCQAEEYWLNGYTSFQAIKNQQDQKPWYEWPVDLRQRKKEALNATLNEVENERQFYRFVQWLYENQWQDIHRYAKEKDIEKIGDVAIFVAHDSADVWEHQALFNLDESGQPFAVAGVPPDYFSATGQRWGNPLYNWPAIQADDFRWWKQRIAHTLKQVSLVRIDHFRGFEAYWEIPIHEETAINGHWKSAPGEAFFNALSQDYSPLPIIAEDLGIITPEVEALRDRFKLPGMKILQFAFDSDSKNPYLPHNHTKNSVVFTGTHDNNTSLGWYNNLPQTVQKNLFEYLTYPLQAMPWPIINSALASVSQLAIIPFQDLLELNEEHRMNTPGTTEGNWRWRFSWSDLPPELAKKCLHLNNLYGRNNSSC